MTLTTNTTTTTTKYVLGLLLTPGILLSAALNVAQPDNVRLHADSDFLSVIQKRSLLSFRAVSASDSVPLSSQVTMTPFSILPIISYTILGLLVSYGVLRLVRLFRASSVQSLSYGSSASISTKPHSWLSRTWQSLRRRTTPTRRSNKGVHLNGLELLPTTAPHTPDTRPTDLPSFKPLARSTSLDAFPVLSLPMPVSMPPVSNVSSSGLPFWPRTPALTVSSPSASSFQTLSPPTPPSFAPLPQRGFKVPLPFLPRTPSPSPFSHHYQMHNLSTSPGSPNRQRRSRSLGGIPLRRLSASRNDRPVSPLGKEVFEDTDKNVGKDATRSHPLLIDFSSSSEEDDTRSSPESAVSRASGSDLGTQRVTRSSVGLDGYGALPLVDLNEDEDATWRGPSPTPQKDEEKVADELTPHQEKLVDVDKEEVEVVQNHQKLVDVSEEDEFIHSPQEENWAWDDSWTREESKGGDLIKFEEERVEDGEERVKDDEGAVKDDSWWATPAEKDIVDPFEDPANVVDLEEGLLHYVDPAEFSSPALERKGQDLDEPVDSSMLTNDKLDMEPSSPSIVTIELVDIENSVTSVKQISMPDIAESMQEMAIIVNDTVEDESTSVVLAVVPSDDESIAFTKSEPGPLYSPLQIGASGYELKVEPVVEELAETDAYAEQPSMSAHIKFDIVLPSPSQIVDRTVQYGELPSPQVHDVSIEKVSEMAIMDDTVEQVEELLPENTLYSVENTPVEKADEKTKPSLPLIDVEVLHSSPLPIRPELPPLEMPLIMIELAKDEEFPDPDYMDLPVVPLVLPAQFKESKRSPELEPLSQTPTPPASPPLLSARSVPPSPRRELAAKPAWSVRASDSPVLGLSSSGEGLGLTSPSLRQRKFAIGEKEKEKEERLEAHVMQSSISLPGSFPDVPSEPSTSIALPAPAATSKTTSATSNAGINLESTISSTLAVIQPPAIAHLRLRTPRSPIDIALAMQLRPGLGAGADPAWMVRFLMAMWGWFAIMVSGTGEF